MARNSAEAVLPADDFLTVRRRRPFEFWPDHPEGVTFGFLFRLLVAVLSVTFGTILLVIAGSIFTGWQLTWWLLVVFGLFIVGLIYTGEHFRSRVFERVVSDERTSEIQMDEIDELVLRELRKEAAGLNRVARVAKRTFDLVVATMGLLVLSPLLVMIAIAIRMDSDGPILFRQVRYDFNRRPLKLYKFRTMAAIDGATIMSSGVDAAVTKVGRVLRRTNWDELPQLINVLSGEMSIVGPRPLMTAPGPQEYEHGGALGLEPGITGWAQVHGYRGALDTPEKVRHMVEHDLWYFHHWSILLDLRIIFMTVFTRRAYTSV
jgi:lipopolysaccharide/colanic/teichoic acid biosynthesis glycosyltransferase